MTSANDRNHTVKSECRHHVDVQCMMRVNVNVNVNNVYVPVFSLVACQCGTTPAVRHALSMATKPRGGTRN